MAAGRGRSPSPSFVAGRARPPGRSGSAGGPSPYRSGFAPVGWPAGLGPLARPPPAPPSLRRLSPPAPRRAGPPSCGARGGPLRGRFAPSLPPAGGPSRFPPYWSAGPPRRGSAGLLRRGGPRGRLRLPCRRRRSACGLPWAALPPAVGARAGWFCCGVVRDSLSTPAALIAIPSGVKARGFPPCGHGSEWLQPGQDAASGERSCMTYRQRTYRPGWALERAITYRTERRLTKAAAYGILTVVTASDRGLASHPYSQRPAALTANQGGRLEGYIPQPPAQMQ